MKTSLAINLAISAFLISGCSGGVNSAPPSSFLPAGSPQSELLSLPSASDSTSVLRSLTHEFTIGSTVDPNNGAANPYGLDIAKSSSGKIVAGDLVVCNFNDSTGVQGTGASIIALRPHAGAATRPVTENKELTGCTELALSPNDIIWDTSFAKNAVAIFSSSGAFIRPVYFPFNHPFGIAFAPHATSLGVAAFYESSAGDGSIVRISIAPSGSFFSEVIATGFAINGGAPGSILGPSGLQYDKANDRLFIVDGANNTLVRFDQVTTIRPGGIRISGTSISGPDAHLAHLLFHGAPLNGPISSALLPGGHIVVSNTLDPNGKNLIIEFNADGSMLDVKNVDTGPQGALFGMVATGTDLASTKLYFNDDNDNTVKVLEP